MLWIAKHRIAILSSTAPEKYADWGMGRAIKAAVQAVKRVQCSSYTNMFYRAIASCLLSQATFKPNFPPIRLGCLKAFIVASDNMSLGLHQANSDT